jgi:hypothetical protein
MTILITWLDGTTTSFTDCADFAIEGDLATFKGVKQDQGTERKFKVNMRAVRMIETEGS